MVKETSWSDSFSIFEKPQKRKYTKNTGDVGYELSDLPEIIGSFIEKITLKRLNKAESLIYSRVEKESNRLFLIIANTIGAGGLSHNPFDNNRVWPKLRDYYIKRKGHSNFWYNKGILRDWLMDANNKPSDVFGSPRIKFALNPRAIGYQLATVSITPYPNVKNPNFPTDTPDENTGSIKDKLFFRHNYRGLYRASNEELRPIISPTIQLLLKNRILKVVKSTMKEALENGR